MSWFEERHEVFADFREVVGKPRVGSLLAERVERRVSPARFFSFSIVLQQGGVNSFGVPLVLG